MLVPFRWPRSQALPTRQKRPSLRRASGQLQFGEAADGIEDVGVHDELTAGTTYDDVELFGDDWRWICTALDVLLL